MAGHIGDIAEVVLFLGLLPSLLVALLGLRFIVTLPRTRSGYSLYGWKHFEDQVRVFERVMHPENYETQDEVRRRRKLSRTIADQIIAGRTPMPAEKFNLQFESAFARLASVDLDLDRPVNLLTPSLVLRCLIHNLFLDVRSDRDSVPSSGTDGEDDKRVAELDAILDASEASGGTAPSAQMEVVLRAINVVHAFGRTRLS